MSNRHCDYKSISCNDSAESGSLVPFVPIRYPLDDDETDTDNPSSVLVESCKEKCDALVDCTGIMTVPDNVYAIVGQHPCVMMQRAGRGESVTSIDPFGDWMACHSKIETTCHDIPTIGNHEDTPWTTTTRLRARHLGGYYYESTLPPQIFFGVLGGMIGFCLLCCICKCVFNIITLPRVLEDHYPVQSQYPQQTSNNGTTTWASSRSSSTLPNSSFACDVDTDTSGDEDIVAEGVLEDVPL